MTKNLPLKIHHTSKLMRFLSQYVMVYAKKAARKIGFVKNLSFFYKILLLTPSLHFKKTFFVKPVFINAVKCSLRNALASFVLLGSIQSYMDLKK